MNFCFFFFFFCFSSLLNLMKILLTYKKRLPEDFSSLTIVRKFKVPSEKEMLTDWKEHRRMARINLFTKAKFNNICFYTGAKDTLYFTSRIKLPFLDTIFDNKKKNNKQKEHLLLFLFTPFRIFFLAFYLNRYLFFYS